MSNWSVLKITNGTQTIDLLSDDNIDLQSWTPSIADYKGGGIVQESPLSEGSGYSFGRYGNVIENMTFHIKGLSQDQTIRAAQRLRELLAQAFTYGPTRWQSKPVWIEAKAAQETNTRYAVIVSSRMPQDGYQYGQPFQPLHGQSAMVNLAVQIERQHWLSKKPGESDAVTGLTSYQFWNAALNFVEVTTGSVPDLPAPVTSYIVETVEDDTVLVFDTGASGNIYRSTDRGTTWTSVQSGVQIVDVLKITDNYIIAADQTSGDQLLYSTDKGATWSQLSSTWGNGYLNTLQDNSTLIGIDLSLAVPDVYTSSDQGATWTNVGDLSVDGVGFVISSKPYYKKSNGYIYIAWSASSTLVSTDDGATWSEDRSLPSLFSGINSQDKIITAGSGIHIGDSDVLYRTSGTTPTVVQESFDDGENFYEINDLENSWTHKNITQNDSGELFVSGESLYIQSDTYGHTYIFGGSSNNRVDIANYQATGQITHILPSDDDGSTFGPNIWPIREATDIYTFDPGSDVGADLFFGSDTSIDGAGPFCSLRFNISTAATGTFVISWKYWDGSAWSTLTAKDNTSSFANEGVVSVHWEQPTDWATTTLDGVTGWWVRADTTSAIGATSPEQTDEDIYTINTSFVEIPQAQIGGDIPALCSVRLTNISSNNSGNMETNRAICGLRSTSRGIRFRPYINLGDTTTNGDLGNPTGVTVADDQATTASAGNTANGYKLTYSPGAAESLVTAATISMDTFIADEYSGTYRAFVRCHQTAGSVGDAEIAIGVRSNSGDPLTTTETVSVATLDDWQLVDLGQIQIHSDYHIPGVEIGDQAQIVIKVGSNSASTVLDLYDVVLMPIDEWSGDFQDRENTSSSRVDNGQYIEIDSVGYPKHKIRSFVRKASGVTKANYAAITNGAAVLQANTTQRIYFLCASYGSSSDWISEPWISHSVTINAVQRYLGARGNY